jgi:hypothetical protein
MNKIKINVKEKLFYSQIFFIFIAIILLTIYFLDSIIIGTKVFDNLSEKLQNKKLKLYLTGKIISYVINCFILLMYVCYLVIIRHKIKIGYVFCLI